ncbi:MAG: antibiotic biosynthesis monooxygenase [Pyrinomonadaceae bacterium]|nr:antibiotic biosynthesis monooxygenase [Pyrinomonadaceae bacterium]
MSEYLYLTAQLKVRNDKVEELKSAALAIVADSRAEDGCISYNVHQSIEDETIFIWRESWKSKDDLNKHFEKDYVKEFFVFANEVAAEPPKIFLTKLLTN